MSAILEVVDAHADLKITAVCPLCDEPTEKILTRVLRRGTGTVFHCEACDLGFLVAAKVDAAEHYDGEYRQHASHKADGSATDATELFTVYSRYQKDRVALVSPHLRKDSSVLELGASAGQFLWHLIGKCKRRCAIEPDRECCAFMDNLGIETDHHFLPESKFAGEKFDVVCAFQTLEHVSDPVAFLEDVRSVLKPGGVAFIEVPNLHDALRTVWKIPEYEKFYFHSDHLFYFSAKALELAATSAGFKNPTVTFMQDYNLLATLHWITMKAPHPTCDVGLSPITFAGNKDILAVWLADAMSKINALYTNGLVARGATSNIMAVLTT